MKIYGKIAVRLMVLSTLVLLCGACSSGESKLDTVPEGEVNFSAQQSDMKSGSATNSTTPADKGVYYLGYKENNVSVLKSITIGDGGTVAGTGIYWTKVTKDDTKGAKFTLSNVNQAEDGSPVIPESRDILWANTTQWGGTLPFTLQHVMAQVRVKLTFDGQIDRDAIESVSLVNMGVDIQFDRATGIVSTTPAPGDTKLTETPDSYVYLFPAQKRLDEMQLKVVLKDGKVFARALPFAMSQDIGNGDREDIPLRLRSGYILHLSAKVTNIPDLTLFFTGATLEDWEKLADATIGVKPAGIYTMNELLEWATAYATSSAETNFHLRRYGAYDANAQKWTFTVKRKITCPTTAIPALPIITSFVDILDGETVTGLKQADLILDATGGSVGADIFDN